MRWSYEVKLESFSTMTSTEIRIVVYVESFSTRIMIRMQLFRIGNIMSFWVQIRISLTDISIFIWRVSLDSRYWWRDDNFSSRNWLTYNHRNIDERRRVQQIMKKTRHESHQDRRLTSNMQIRKTVIYYNSRLCPYPHTISSWYGKIFSTIKK